MREVNDMGLLEFSEKKVVGVAKIELELTEENIENIMVTGLEGGIGYWARLENEGEEWNAKPNDIPVSQWATELLLQGKEVVFSDSELDEGDIDYYHPPLTLEKLIKGFELNYKHRPHDNNIETGDVTTADCIIQYAVFGEVVYG